MLAVHIRRVYLKETEFLNIIYMKCNRNNYMYHLS
jgi:hypothetical protein